MRFSLVTAASLLATLAAARPSLVSRVNDACPIETTPGSGDAGIGAEFETVVFKLKNDQCSLDETWGLKKKVIDEQQGDGFQLTVDTTDKPGILQPEIILDGRKIQVGKGNAATVGKEAMAMFNKWWGGADKNDVQVADSVCKPWKMTETKGDPKDFEWDPQVTAPMPLEALYTLMREQQFYTIDSTRKRPNVINGLETKRIRFPGRSTNLVVATKSYFRESPNGMDPEKLDDDVLGFLSLVLTYAKAAHPLHPGESPKLLITYMPRTDFNTMFAQVKARVPGDLFKLIEHLACYRTDERNKNLQTNLDKDFCEKNNGKLAPNGKLAGLKYTSAKGEMSVKKWIEDIQAGTGKDLLSKFDEINDSSLGGLGKRLENAYGTQRGVPLFEFRDLDFVKTSDIEEFMRKVDENVQKLHKGAAKAAAQKRAADPKCRPSGSSTSSSASATKTSSSKASMTKTSSSTPSNTKTTSSKTTSTKTTKATTKTTKTTKTSKPTKTTKATTKTTKATTKTTKATTKTTKTSKPTKTKN